ncbi:MAG TPA: phage tail tape measure protein [Candidatus Paceibacterota bacterium]|nr:phage tail tape measure protein [Candidatus Paceibacterota bacterium]
MNIDVNFISNINKFIEEQLSFKRTIDSTKESINELNKEMTSKVSGAGFAKNLAEDIEIARLKLNRLSSELKKLYAQRREGATPSPQWTNEMDKLKAKTATARAELAKLNKEFKEFNAVPKKGGGSNFIQSWGKYLLRYYVAFQGIQMAMQGISNAYNTLKDFEYAMAGVKAVSGATASEFENLKQKAIALSGTTLFNAVDIAKLEEVYSKAGFTIKQIAAMIEPTLKTATATDDSLENTSELLGGIINGFKLNADNTKHIADVMGLAFNKSMLDLSKFKESMKYVGNIAAEAGFSFEEVSAILMVASNNMMSGSMAGTALRQVFNSMLNPTSKFSKAIGGTVYGLEGFMNALKGLKEKGADLGTMFQITDKRAANLFNIMMNNTDQLKLFTKQAKNANGEMDKMAAIKMDTLTGQTARFNGEWKKLILTMGKGTGFFKELMGGLADAIDVVTAGSLRYNESLVLINNQQVKQRKHISDSLEVYESLAKKVGKTVAENNKLSTAISILQLYFDDNIIKINE